MCDDFTAADGNGALARTGLTRRALTAIGAAAVLTTYAQQSLASTGTLDEHMVDVETPDGKADAFYVHPAKGRYPGVIFWPDALGLREAKKVMARRLAAEGYAVLVVNPYYRNVRAPLDMDFAAMLTPAGRQKIGPFMPSLTPDAISRDAVAYVAFLNAQAAVDVKRGVGVQGYCFGGPLAIRTAAAVPDRVKAAATFHGGGLVTDKLDSPHHLLGQTHAAFLIAVARNDDQKAPDDRRVFQAAAETAKRSVEVEVYAGDHGWCVPDAPSYNPDEASRAFGRLLALYAKL